MFLSFRRFLEFTYPKACCFCGDILSIYEEGYSCNRCMAELEFINEYEAIAFKQEFIHNSCFFYQDGYIFFDSLLCAVKYNEVSRKAILWLKFSGERSVARGLALMLAYSYKKSIYSNLQFDCIISVPLHKARERKRGYNQSELISYFFSKHINVPVKQNVIQKTKHTLAQSTLSHTDRQQNIKDCFSVCNIEIIRGKRIILVDDVVTTGATVNEVAKALKLAGAEYVLVCAVSLAWRGNQRT